MVSYEKIKAYKKSKINELMDSKEYTDFLENTVMPELYKQIDKNPLCSSVYIGVPKELIIDIVIERLVNDYDYQEVLKEEDGKYRCIIINL